MNINFKQHLGWTFAAVLAGFLVFSGFQNGQEKTAVVDMNKVIADSKLGKKNVDDLKNLVDSRQNLLTFLDTNRVATQEQASKLKTYALKGAPLTDAERQDDERIKNDVKNGMKTFSDLNQKPNPTDQDRIQLQDFNQRVRTMVQMLQAWNQEFSEDLSKRQGDMRKNEIERAREALSAVSKKGGFSVVFEAQVAPFGANDLTQDAIKEMDSKTN